MSQIMDYSMLLGIHYPKRVIPDKTVVGGGAGGRMASGGFERTSVNMDQEGAVRNFAEMDSEMRFKELFPRLAERVNKLKIGDEAK